MKKLNRRIVAATASIALAVGIFAAVPLSAEARTNYKISKSSEAPSFGDSEVRFSAQVNGI
jgi:hypothetical protein